MEVRMSGAAKRQIPYRDDAAVIGALEQQGRLRGRTVSEELRLAVRLWLRKAMLAQLNDPTGAAEAARQGFDVESDRVAIKKEIAEIERNAFRLPRSNLRDALVESEMETTA
jgi:hypothetical protein